MPHKAIILLSGGVDSAVCLWWSKPKEWEMHALTFNYHPLSHDMDVRAARNLAKTFGVTKHLEIDLPFLREFRDLNLTLDHPLAGQGNKIPPSYVPGRNMIFYGIAAHFAEETGAKWIIGGHNKDDFNHFPDSNVNFFEKLNELIRNGTMIGGKHVAQIITPLSHLDKNGVIDLGVKLHVPFHLTWSCHVAYERPCRKCLSCRQRRAAFEALGIRDPAVYDQ